MLPLILDTDIGTDVDDALALAFALRHPDIDLRAVTTVSGDVVRRAEIARKLLLIAGRDDIEVAPGLAAEPPEGRSPWMGHEGRGLLEVGEHLGLSGRDGPALLLEECARSPAVTLATVGMQTNVAAALDRGPALTERLGCLTVMGGVFAPVHTGRDAPAPASDHNLNCDPAAALRSLNAGLPTLYVPLDVTVHTTLTHDQVDRLRAGDELCRALVRLIEVWTPVMAVVAGRPLPPERAALLHDPLTVACTVDRRLVTIEEVPVTVALHEGSVRTFVDHATGRPAEVVTSVDGAAFSELWLDTVLSSN